LLSRESIMFNLNHLTNNKKYDIGIDNEKI